MQEEVGVGAHLVIIIYTTSWLVELFYIFLGQLWPLLHVNARLHFPASWKRHFLFRIYYQPSMEAKHEDRASMSAKHPDDPAFDDTCRSLRILHAEEGDEVDAEARKRLVRKLDLRLLPILCITYALQSIDRTTLSYAAVFGIRQDLGLSSAEFSWAGALLYVGYLFWEFPTNLMLQKLPIHRFMASTVLLWGVALMCHGAVANFSGLAAVRAFLGAFEASINPGTMLLFSMYYERGEQPLRMGIWVGSAGVGYVVAGIVTFGIGHVQGSLESWRLLFLFWGAVTVAWGVVVMVFLPGSPLTTGFLTEQERALVVNRVKNNGTGIDNKQFKWSQFGEAMTDLKTWLLFAFAVASNSPNGGLTVVIILFGPARTRNEQLTRKSTQFQGVIINGMGFSVLQTTLIQMPSGGVQLVVCVLAWYT